MSKIQQELRLNSPRVAQDERQLYKFKRVSEEEWELALEGKRKSDEITLVDALGDLADKEQPKQVSWYKRCCKKKPGVAAIDEKNYDIDNINIELNTFMAG